MLQLAEAEVVVPPNMFPRSREIWAPLLQLAHLFEQEGATGLLGTMQEFAENKAEVAEQLLVPELDAAVLRAAVFLNGSGAKAPTAGEIAARAQVADTGTAGHVTNRKVGAILRRYGINHRLLNGRYVYELPPTTVAELEDRYGMVLTQPGEKNEPPIPLRKPPTSPTSPRESVRGDKGDVGGQLQGNPVPKIPENGKVKPGKVVL